MDCQPVLVVPEDGALEDGLHGYRVAGPAGAGRHPEEPVLWIDGPQLTLLVGPQPGDIVTHHAHLPQKMTTT